MDTDQRAEEIDPALPRRAQQDCNIKGVRKLLSEIC